MASEVTSDLNSKLGGWKRPQRLAAASEVESRPGRSAAASEVGSGLGGRERPRRLGSASEVGNLNGSIGAKLRDFGSPGAGLDILPGSYSGSGS